MLSLISFRKKYLIKNEDFLFLFSIVMMLVMTNMGSLMYLPALSDISSYFNIDPSKASNISRVDFIGLALGCLFVSSFINAYGIRLVVLCSILLFSTGSLIASLTPSFPLLLFICFLMGAFKAVPTVMCVSMILSKYKEVKANNMMLLTRIFDMGSLIIIPTLAVFVLEKFQWRGEYVSLAIVGAITFTSSYFFVKDLKRENNVEKFSIKKFFIDYKNIVTNTTYISNAVIFVIPPILITLFMNSASLVMVKLGEISVHQYGNFGSVLVVVYIIFCLISIYITNKKGIDYCKNIGFFVVLIGTIIIVLSRIEIITYDGNHYSFLSNKRLIFIGLLFCSAGSAMMNGFFIRATLVFPNNNNAISFIMVLSSLITARAISWVNYLYDNTMLPSIWVIICLTVLMTFSFIALSIKNKKVEKQKHIQ